MIIIMIVIVILLLLIIIIAILPIAFSGEGGRKAARAEVVLVMQWNICQ